MFFSIRRKHEHARSLLACVLLLFSALTAATAHAEQEEPGTGLQLVPSYPAGAGADVLLVTLIDGSLVALDHDSGQVLWRYDTGAPLVSARQTSAPSQGMNLVPGAYGELYAYQGLQQPSNPGLQRLPISLPELVEAAPSLTADGSIILGRRESKVFLLDKRTGRSITTLSNAADALEDHSASMGLSHTLGQDDVLVLGRQDYMVRSMRVDSKAETWNATFSRLYMMSRDSNSIKDFFRSGAAPKLGGVRARADLPHLVVGSDNSLQAYDSRTMLQKWYIAFDAMPISAHRQDDVGGNYLDPANAALRGGSSPGTGLAPHVQLNPLSHTKLKAQLPGGTTVLVGAIKGSLYALPADHLMLAADADDGLPGSSGAVVWPQRVGRLPLDITPADADFCDAAPTGSAAAEAAPPEQGRALPSASPAIAGPVAADSPAPASDGSGSEAADGCGGPNGSCSNAGLTVVDEPHSPDSTSLVALEPSDSGLLEELGSLTCPQPPLGIHSIAVQQAQALAWLPDTTAKETAEHLQSWSTLQLLLTGLAGLLLLPLLFGWRVYRISSSKAPAMQPVPLADGAATASPSKAKKSKGRGKAKKQAAGDDSTAAPVLGNGVASDQDVVNSDASSGAHSSSNDLQQQFAAAAAAAAAAAPAGQAPDVGSAQALRPPSAAGSVSASPAPPSPSTSALGSDLGAVSPLPLSPVAAEGSFGGAHGTLASRSYVDEDGAVVIGRLRVGPGILGYGSAGTIVYEGVLDSRPVAVKRLLRQFYNLARKEIQVLVVSDEHPNVVRCFAMEEDREFVYLALERCRHSLSDTLGSKEGQQAMQDPVTGSPTPWCMAVLADIAAGLAALHQRQIVHRDLKPHNVLLTEAGRAKLSDMGLSKQLVSEQSSFESHGSGGSSGWQAPEQLLAKDGGAVRQSRAVDVFSLGCIMYYCLTAGRHPFGEHYERDTNILRGLCTLTGLQRSPQAYNLVSAMLSKSPGQRPNMPAVLGHPFWWSEEQRLQFLVDVSDRVENEDREPDPSLLHALESYTAAAVGPNWGAGLDPELIANLGKYRRYDYTCLRDLLRVVRNKRNHFREMPDSLQVLLGPVPDGYYRYFASRFPLLLLGVFFFALKHLDGDANLAKYWPSGQHQFAAFLKPWESMAVPASARAKGAKGPAGRRSSGSGLNSSRFSPSPVGGPSIPPRPPSAAGSSAGGQTAAAATAALLAAADASRPGVVSFRVVAAAAAARESGPANGSSGGNSREGLSNGGLATAAAAAAGSGGGAADGSPPVVGYTIAEEEEVLHMPSFPLRPGKQHCDFYVKTGHCKYGVDCVFDHPPEYVVPLTEQGLPFRPGQPVCTFYQKTQQCKYGPSCKFHHPKLVPIYAGSARQQ